MLPSWVTGASVPDVAIHHGPLVPVEISPEQMADLYIPDKDIMMLDLPSWLNPTIPRSVHPYTGVGPMVPYVPEDPMGSDYSIRPDDPNPRPQKYFQSDDGTLWGLRPAVSDGRPSTMDYILGQLD